MKPAGVIRLFLLFISSSLLLYFLFWHWKLGMVRYFDVDEFAHLHWAARMMAGEKPYIDFLTFFPPGFAWFLMPALAIGWGTIQPFLIARGMMFAVFFVMCVLSGLIFWELRRSVWGAVLAAALLAFLPLPFDKYLEIRPDSLATVLVLAAVYAQIRWMVRTPQNKSTLRFEILSGIFYSLSYIVLPKMAPNIAVGMLIAGIYARSFKTMKYFIFGLVLPCVLFSVWAFTLGDPGLVWYSLFRLPLESNKISQYFIMMQDLFFNPNGIYYGADGWNRGLLTNHAIWIFGIVFGAWRLITSGKYAEILMALQFFAQLYFFVQLAPLKHAQYLIPIGVFVAWYAADGIVMAGKYLSVKPVFPILFVLGAIYLSTVFNEVNTAKAGWTNAENLSRIETLYKKIPQNEPVLDLTGEMLYNPDAYYACCIPFGQFAGFLSRPLPDLPKALETGQVKYINQGTLKRVATLPPAWQEYIVDTFRAFEGDDSFLIRK